MCAGARWVRQVRVDGLEPRRLSRLRRELTHLQTLRHENIVDYHAAFQDGTSLCIVQEYAAGGTLDEAIALRVSQGARFETGHVARWLHELAAGLSYMHEHRVLHRDLATKNVFLSLAGIVKIGDFGLSRELGTTASNLAVTSFCGTPFYASPEMFSGRTRGAAAQTRDHADCAARAPPHSIPRVSHRAWARVCTQSPTAVRPTCGRSA